MRTIRCPIFKSRRTSDRPRKPQPPKTTQVLGFGKAGLALGVRDQAALCHFQGNPDEKLRFLIPVLHGNAWIKIPKIKSKDTSFSFAELGIS
ncbi:hypothetical protein ACFXTN_040173 [Malus domestica]